MEEYVKKNKKKLLLLNTQELFEGLNVVLNGKVKAVCSNNENIFIQFTEDISEGKKGPINKYLNTKDL